MSRYKQTHLISWCLWWWCCSCWCGCWRPDRNMDRSGPHWRWTAPTVDLWCSQALLWRPTGAELEDWTELNRAWSDWIQLKRKCCYFHSLLAPCCLDHLRKEKSRGMQHFRALMVKLENIVHGGDKITHSWWQSLMHHCCHCWQDWTHDTWTVPGHSGSRWL